MMLYDYVDWYDREGGTDGEREEGMKEVVWRGSRCWGGESRGDGGESRGREVDAEWRTTPNHLSACAHTHTQTRVSTIMTSFDTHTHRITCHATSSLAPFH